MKRQTACEKNDALVRKMIADGATLTEVAEAVETNRTRVKEHIERNNIPHRPYRSHGHSAERNGRWKGGVIVDKDGYRLVKIPSHPNADRHGYVREHRLVMESMIERYLTLDEVVHHIDGNKQNNSPDNLHMFARNSEHLAETLAGKVPLWTPDGYRRILEGTRKPKPRRQKPIPAE